MKKTDKSIINSFNVKLAFVLVITIVLSSTLTYGFFYAGREQTGQNELNTSCFNVAFTEGESIDLKNALSMSDKNGQNTKPYTFSIENTCDLETTYHVLVNTIKNGIADNHINISLDKGTPRTLSTISKNTADVSADFGASYVLTTGSLKQGEKKTFNFRAWINEATTYEDVQGKTWSAEIKVTSTVKVVETVADKIISNVKAGNPDFSVPATTDEGLYALEDDYGTSYYFRGAVNNNYIKYGKNKDGQDMYWRIVRINGDGSLRIIYDGTQAYANGTADDARYAKVGQVWNTQYNDAKYVGYMFGGAQGEASTSKEGAQANDTNSEVKMAVENWYKENIVDTGYGNNVVDAIFCNDRSTPGQEATEWPNDTGLGYGKNDTAYGATVRTGAWNSATVAPQPKFTCNVRNDAFTENENEKGNGKSTYPVGLITADEIMAAGGKYGKNNNQYYLYKSSNYYGWSLSPYLCLSNAFVFIIYTSGSLGITNTGHTSGAIAPVINLSAEYVNTLTGDGTMTNPYRAPGVEA